MIDSIMIWWKVNGDSILAVLVLVHLLTEYFHYTYEFLSSRKEKNILKEIISYRKRSTKTQRLINLQVGMAYISEDIALIKKELKIENN